MWSSNKTYMVVRSKLCGSWIKIIRSANKNYMVLEPKLCGSQIKTIWSWNQKKWWNIIADIWSENTVLCNKDTMDENNNKLQPLQITYIHQIYFRITYSNLARRCSPLSETTWHWYNINVQCLTSQLAKYQASWYKFILLGEQGHMSISSLSSELLVRKLVVSGNELGTFWSPRSSL